MESLPLLSLDNNELTPQKIVKDKDNSLSFTRYD